MPFREKSAWIMSLALLAAGAVYSYAVVAPWSESGQLLPPTMPFVIGYTVTLVVMSVVGHIVITALSPQDADAAPDERERQIFHRAGNYSSYLFAVGVVLSLGWYLWSRNGDLLFYGVFASLMLGQVMEYVLQIIYYRTSV